MARNQIRRDRSTAEHSFFAKPRNATILFFFTLLLGITLSLLLYYSYVQRDMDRVLERTHRSLQVFTAYSSEPFEQAAQAGINTTLATISEDIGQGAPVTDAWLDRYDLGDKVFNAVGNTNLRWMPALTETDGRRLTLTLEQEAMDTQAPVELWLRGNAGIAMAMERDVYFPIMAESGSAPRRTPKGTDISGEMATMVAMHQARDTGLMTYRIMYPIAGQVLPKPYIVTHYFYPVYSPGPEPVSIDERRKRLTGFLSAIAYSESAEMLALTPNSYLGMHIIYLPDTTAFNRDSLDSRIQNELDQEQMQSAIYKTGSNTSRIVIRPTDNFIRSMQTNTRWWALGLGLSITFSLSLFLLWNYYKTSQITDIVQRRTRDLAESEKRYRRLADNVSDVIFVHDLDGICKYVTPSIQAQTGHNPSLFIGKEFYSLLVTEDRLKMLNEIRTAAEQGGNILGKTYLLQCHCNHDASTWVEIHLKLLRDRQNKPREFLGIMRDVSARVRAETEKNELESSYRQTQKMEAIGTLAGGIAHDFNNLLTGIPGYIDILKPEISKNKDASQNLEVIESAANRAKELTSQLLGFARKGQFQAVPVKVNAIAHEVALLVGRTIDRRIEVVENLACEDPIITGDPGQISQILLNLAINARDAMPDGGKIMLETSLIELDPVYCRSHTGTLPGNYCLLQVSDTGCGIAPDKLDKIFEPFFTDKEDGKGTGMGLAMVYGVAKSHGGGVSVQSELGHGSTFKVYLPLRNNEDSQKAAVDEKPALIKGKGLVLVVDDVDMIRKLASKMLPRLGYDVLLASSAAEALELYRERWQDIDLIIMDMIMPDKNGIECLNDMLAINPELQAVMASGYSEEVIASDMEKDHIIGFLQKPFRLEKLSATLAEILVSD